MLINFVSNEIASWIHVSTCIARVCFVLFNRLWDWGLPIKCLNFQIHVYKVSHINLKIYRKRDSHGCQFIRLPVCRLIVKNIVHVHVYGFIHTQGFKMHSNYWWLNKFLFTPKLTPTGFFNHLGGFWSGITFCVFSVTGVACANGSLELNASATYPNSDTF